MLVSIKDCINYARVVYCQLLLALVSAYYPPSLATSLLVLIESNMPEYVALCKVLTPVHIYMYMQCVLVLYRTIVWDVNNKRMVKCYKGTVECDSYRITPTLFIDIFPSLGHSEMVYSVTAHPTDRECFMSTSMVSPYWMTLSLSLSLPLYMYLVFAC